MTKERLRVLYQHYLLGTLTNLEHKEWQLMLNSEDLKQALEEVVEEGWYAFSETEFQSMDENTEGEIFEHIIAQPQQKTKKAVRWKPYLVAASLFLVAGISLYRYTYKLTGRTEPLKSYSHEVKPGGNKACLTLSNGTKIALEELKEGVLAMQGGVEIIKTSDGRITYKVTDRNVNSNPNYNVIETPKGGQYQISLPDGTRVWLNAASSLKYPSVFKGKERIVELKGEAYFEVSKNKNMPFKVLTASQEVEVLGTHFNINSYQEEPVTNTALLEGSIRVTAINEPGGVVIKPGQQTQLRRDTKIKVVNANMEEVIAWKNNYFRFNDEKIETIMRKISRWYDVSIQFEGEPVKEEFNGTISRTKNIEEVLEMLESTKTVHFRIEGRRVVVMK